MCGPFCILAVAGFKGQDQLSDLSAAMAFIGFCARWRVKRSS